MITDPSAILVICTSLREDVVFFSLKEAHFYPCSLQISSSLRIAWDLGVRVSLAPLQGSWPLPQLRHDETERNFWQAGPRHIQQDSSPNASDRSLLGLGEHLSSSLRHIPKSHRD